MHPRRAYVNVAEEAFAQAAEANGYTVTKRGWPDFLCFKDGDVICVEVKPTSLERSRGVLGVKVEQHRTMTALARYGIRCYRWDPEGGFTRIYADAESLTG